MAREKLSEIVRRAECLYASGAVKFTRGVPYAKRPMPAARAMALMVLVKMGLLSEARSDKISAGWEEKYGAPEAGEEVGAMCIMGALTAADLKTLKVDTLEPYSDRGSSRVNELLYQADLSGDRLRGVNDLLTLPFLGRWQTWLRLRLLRRRLERKGL